MDALSTDVVQPEALWERVVAAMRQAIVTGELVPGAHLKEPPLAQRFGVSRLPVREAIARLEREGLVRIEPRRGAFVVGCSDEDISDIYDCRTIIEACAVRRVAGRIDDQGVVSLQALIDQMDAAVRAGQLPFVAASDMAFHRQLIILSGSRALRSAWEPLAPLIETILGITDPACTNLPVAVEEHRAITVALQRGDVEAAEAAIRQQMKGGEEIMRRAMRQMHGGETASP